MFTGDIDGFFKDFVVYGNLSTPLGKVNLDTRLDIKNGADEAEYSGVLSLDNFNLSAWTGNPDLGMATFRAEIRDGKGLNSKNLLTDLSAKLETFEYKGYSYSDVSLNGVFEQNSFNGKLVSKDVNASFDFDGNIFYEPKTKRVDSDFKVDIKNIDLVSLNLSKQFSNLNGDMVLKIKGSQADDLIGQATLKDFEFLFEGKEYMVEEFFVSSSPQSGGNRNVQVSSDFLNGTLSGKFGLQGLKGTFFDHMAYAHPKWSSVLKIDKTHRRSEDQDFQFKFVIDDTRDYLKLAGIDEVRIEDALFTGKVNSIRDEYESKLLIKKFTHAKSVISDLLLDFNENDTKGNHKLDIGAVKVGDMLFNPIHVNLDVLEDDLKFSIMTEEVFDSLQGVDLVIHAYPEGDDIIAKVADGSVDMLSSHWAMNPANEVRIASNSIDIKGFVLSDGYRDVILSDINNRGLLVSLQKFDFELINGIIDYDKIDFTGEGSVVLIKEDLFQPSNVRAKVHLPEFLLNDVDYGDLSLVVVDNGSDKVDAELKLERAYDGLLLHLKELTYEKSTKAISGILTARNLVMNTFEFIINDGISNTGGTAHVDAVLSGTADAIENVKLDGFAQVLDGTTTIDYLGAELYFGTEKFRVTDSYIDLTGGRLYDRYRNEALITGRLNHTLFSDFTTDLTMSSDNFLA